MNPAHLDTEIFVRLNSDETNAVITASAPPSTVLVANVMRSPLKAKPDPNPVELLRRYEYQLNIVCAVLMSFAVGVLLCSISIAFKSGAFERAVR